MPARSPRRLRRIERQFGQEALARGELLRDALELQQVARRAPARCRTCAPGAARTTRARAPPGPATVLRAAPASASAPRTAARPSCASARRRELRQACPGMRRWPRSASKHARRRRPARCRAAAAARERRAMRFFGLSAQRSTASMSLTCAASRNFRPPYFT